MADEKKCCVMCSNNWEEQWPGDKTALRCSADCPQQGYVVAIFPAGHEASVLSQPAPVWCAGYCKK